MALPALFSSLAGTIETKIAGSVTKAGTAAGKFAQDMASMAASSTKATGILGGLVQSVLKSFMDPLEQMKALAGPIVELVALANPAVVKQFTLAMNDAMAVFGQIATPVLKGMTLYVRAFGDAWAKVAPILTPLMERLGQTFADMGLIAARTLEAWAPLLELLVDTMIPVIQELGLVFARVNGFVVELIKTLLAFFGIKSQRFDPKANSTGAAVRSASLNSVEGFAKDLFTKNLQNLFGGNQTKDPAAIQTEILAAIEAGKATFNEIKDAVKGIFEFIKDAAKVPAKVVDKATDAAGTAADWGAFGVGGYLARAMLKRG